MFSLKKTVAITTVALIVGVLAGFQIGKLIFRDDGVMSERMDEKKIEEGSMNLRQDANEFSKEEKNKAQIPKMVSSGDNAILVSDQAPGGRVVILSVTLSQAGWVVIHEDRNGKPGSILGAHRFEKGTRSGSVDLLRRTESGRIYYAMIHGDDDGDHVFDYKKDLPVQDVSGNTVMVKFTAVRAPVLQ